MLLHDSAARETIVRRIDSLSPDSRALWGRMRVDQMLRHMSSALEVALLKRPITRRDTFFMRTAFKFFVLNGPWPKGKAPTSPEFLATEDYDFDAERVQVKGLIQEVAGRRLDDAWGVHPRFGPLTGKEWSRLHHKHFNHHLEQFGV